jgi:hypothetical protein
MNKIINIPADIILPSKDSVYDLIEIYDKNKVLEEIKNILSQSLIRFGNLARPAGIILEIPINEFKDIFEGEGNNISENPVMRIYPLADKIALFAVTLGIEIDKKIKNLFEVNLYPEGYMLDSVASCGIENAADYIQDFYTEDLISKGTFDSSKGALRYSPGYCGWDLTGQKKLFEKLEPENIGITLNKSFLMNPLKSISGVLIAGDKSIHSYINYYDFCIECKDYACKGRVKKIFQQ